MSLSFRGFNFPAGIGVSGDCSVADAGLAWPRAASEAAEGAAFGERGTAGTVLNGRDKAFFASPDSLPCPMRVRAAGSRALMPAAIGCSAS